MVSVLQLGFRLELGFRSIVWIPLQLRWFQFYSKDSVTFMIILHPSQLRMELVVNYIIETTVV